MERISLHMHSIHRACQRECNVFCFATKAELTAGQTAENEREKYYLYYNILYIYMYIYTYT